MRNNFKKKKSRSRHLSLHVTPSALAFGVEGMVHVRRVRSSGYFFPKALPYTCLVCNPMAVLQLENDNTFIEDY